MIVTEIYKGSGLGNQLWNLIVTKILAEKHGYSWGVMKTTPFKAHKFMPQFDFGDKVIGGYTHIEGLKPAELPQGIENYIREKPVILPECRNDGIFFDHYLWNELPDKSKLDGTFQCMSYIKGKKEVIRSWLKHNINIKDYSHKDICVIHFRGGEYLIGQSLCPPEYYKMAIEKMLEINPKMRFVVVTDDPKSAKKFIPNVSIIGSSIMKERDTLRQGTGLYEYKGGNIGVDYSILHNAKNVIISASTFSFWPVWTSEFANNVIAPKYWFDYNISNGWWRGVDSIVEEWNYLDVQGELTSGKACKYFYEIYKESSPHYKSGKLISVSPSSQIKLNRKNKLLYLLKEKKIKFMSNFRNTNYKIYLKFIFSKLKRKVFKN